MNKKDPAKQEPTPKELSSTHEVKDTTMKIDHCLRTSVSVTLAGVLALSLFTGCNNSKDARSKLGQVPEFHPELGLGALQGYLDPKALPDSLALIPPPPLDGSAALAHDEEVARSTFPLRDTPRFALAASDFDLKLPHLTSDFSCALNAPITKEDTPYLYTLMSRAFSDLAMSTYAAKNHYQRKRPFQQNNQPMGVSEARAFLEKDASYPSGHTAIGWGYALILTEISPDRDNELLARGRAFGESRTVVNHHWYSDVVWGRFMGAATVARLHADPTFSADLEAARAEVATIRAKGVAPTGDCKAEASALAMGYQTADVTAIDILLDPDATMMKHAAAVNARLRSVYPKGFALDATHRPHVTLLQRFVRTADLDQVYAAANKVLANVNLSDLKLKATKYYYIPVGNLGLSGIVAEPTPELLKLQQDLADAVAPFTVPTGTSGAFVTTPQEPGIQPATINYIAGFVPEHTGKNYSPHVTTGLATSEYLDKMLAQPFDSFSFAPASASVYQLAEYGTAAKKLKDLNSKH
jgi:acid phosphatase (class A)